jgi:hypothetical protein
VELKAWYNHLFAQGQLIDQLLAREGFVWNDVTKTVDAANNVWDINRKIWKNYSNFSLIPSNSTIIIGFIGLTYETHISL